MGNVTRPGAVSIDDARPSSSRRSTPLTRPPPRRRISSASAGAAAQSRRPAGRHRVRPLGTRMRHPPRCVTELLHPHSCKARSVPVAAPVSPSARAAVAPASCHREASAVTPGEAGARRDGLAGGQIRIARFRRCPPEDPRHACSAPAGSRSRRSSPRAAPRRGPGALWLGVPGWAPVAAIVAGVVALALAARRRRGARGAAPASCSPWRSCSSGAAARRRAGALRAAARRAGAGRASRSWSRAPDWRPPRAPLPAAGLRGARRRRPARTHARVGPEGDEPHYLMVAESLLRDGDLSLERDYAEGRYAVFHDAPLEPHYRVRGKGGAIYSLHAVGLSILILPAWALAGYAGVTVFMALLAALVALEVREWVRELTGRDGLAEAAGWWRRSRRLSSTTPASCSPRCRRRSRCRSACGARRRRRARAGRRRRRRPRGGGPAVAERALRAARRPRGRARALAAPARARRSGRLAPAVVVRGGPARLPPGPLRLLGPAPRLRPPPRVRARRRSRRAFPACCSTRSSACSSTPRSSRSRCRASRSSGGAIDGWRSRPAPPSLASCPDRGHVAHVAGRLQPARPLPGADRPPPGRGGGDGLGPARARRPARRSSSAGRSGPASPARGTRSSSTAIATGRRPSSGELSGAREWTGLLPAYVLARPRSPPARRRLGRGPPRRACRGAPGRRRRRGWRSRASGSSSRRRPRPRSPARAPTIATRSGSSAARPCSSPGWRAGPAAARRWSPEALGWGPLYEPHRFPDGAEVGRRLPLPPGRYRLAVGGELARRRPPPRSWSAPDRPGRAAPRSPRPAGADGWEADFGCVRRGAGGQLAAARGRARPVEGLLRSRFNPRARGPV